MQSVGSQLHAWQTHWSRWGVFVDADEAKSKQRLCVREALSMCKGGGVGMCKGSVVLVRGLPVSELYARVFCCVGWQQDNLPRCLLS